MPLAQYLANAERAVAPDYRLAVLRLPEDPGWPVRVVVRKMNAGGNDDLERELVVYLDPPSANVLGVANPRTNFTGTIRRLHRDLLVPDWSGRQIVGWIGFGMLALTLTGLWLWWPRGRFVSGLRWRRSTRTSRNLHYVTGFWIVLPLAIVSATGIYLSFPQTARSLTASFAELAPRELRADRNSRVNALLIVDEATAALRSRHEVKVVSVVAPLRFRQSKAEGGEQKIYWQIQAIGTNGDLQSFLIDDATKAVSLLPPPPRGNRFVQIVHRLHEADGFGFVWSALVFASGALPPLLAVTGFIMWLRTRRRRALPS